MPGVEDVPGWLLFGGQGRLLTCYLIPLHSPFITLHCE